MGEYGREQRNQLGRAIANSETRGRQLKEFADNKRLGELPWKYTIQKAEPAPSLFVPGVEEEDISDTASFAVKVSRMVTKASGLTEQAHLLEDNYRSVSHSINRLPQQDLIKLKKDLQDALKKRREADQLMKKVRRIDPAYPPDDFDHKGAMNFISGGIRNINSWIKK